jgi:uncharacterized OB-fold protein
MQRALDTQLFEWPAAEPRLLGSQCQACGVVSFPQQGSCPSCCGEQIAVRRLGAHGQLWTWTTQAFAPKSPPYAVPCDPKKFTPFLLGYVELPGEVIVETRIAADPSTALSIGMPMQLTFAPLFTDANGVEVVGFAFAPAQESAA